MPIPSSYDIRDLEKNKFVDDGSGNVAVRTTSSGSSIVDAVSIKDGTTATTKAVVKSDGTNNALVVTQNSVPTTTVQATHLDIRHLNTTDDAIVIADGGNTITVDGSVNATCTAIHLDIRHLNTTDDAVNVGTVTTLPSITGTVTANQGGSPWQVQSNSANISTESTLTTMNAKFVSGTDIGDVTINNAGAGSAVNIQDGGNTITIDGSVNVGTITTLPAITGTVSVSNMIPAVETGLATQTTLAAIPGLSIPIHDYISLSYTGSDLTGVIYKTGGSGGTPVATLTLAYNSGNLISVTKT